MSKFDHRKYKRFDPISLPDRTWPNNQIDTAPQWCSVDLRDGNQALIKPMSLAQKEKFFDLLVDIGFKQIEVGFPAASATDFYFVRHLCRENRVPEDVTIQVLTQARPEIIKRTFESLLGAKRVILHIYNPTSPLQRKKVFQLDKAGIVDIAISSARLLKRYAERQPETDWTFQYSPESFSATEVEFAVEVCDAVNRTWQPTPERTVINTLPSTVEVSTPNVYADQIEWFCRHISNRDSVIVSLHTHNDRGCAVAAAELGVMAGAQRVEGTLFGNGERTGNMDVLTMAMNLYSQGVDPQLDLSDMDRITTVVQECTQIDVHPRHPYAGELVFTAFSGGHQDAIKKCLDTYQEGQIWEVLYLPIDPGDLGRSYQNVVRINSQSGKGGIAFVLQNRFNAVLPRWLQIEFSSIVQRRADGLGGELHPDEIWRLFEEHYLVNESKLGKLVLTNIHHDTTTKHGFTAMIDDGYGSTIKIQNQGMRNVEACVNGLRDETQLDFRLLECEQQVVDRAPAQETLTIVRLKFQGKRYAGLAMDTDRVASTMRALLNAINQLPQEGHRRTVKLSQKGDPLA
ncbi:2-isopropylmalate synthase [Myxosarcina sp. GI1(2024)]